MKWSIEITDTFGGDANYSWVKRFDIETDVNATSGDILKEIEVASGFGGFTEAYDDGDSIRFDHETDCVCIFATCY